jgi:Flp pilus assembly protein TadG
MTDWYMMDKKLSDAARMAGITARALEGIQAEKEHKRQEEQLRAAKALRLMIAQAITDIERAACRGAGSMVLGLPSQPLVDALSARGYEVRVVGPQDFDSLTETIMCVRWSLDGDQHWVFRAR